MVIFVLLCLVSVLGWWWLCRMSLGMFLSFQSFGFKKNWCKFFICFVKFIYEAVRLICRKFFFLSFFLTTDFVSLLVASCTNHLFLLDSILECCKLLESCPFLPGCQICWHIIIHRILLFFLYFCTISWDFSFLSFYFVWVLSPFFLVNLARSMSILFTLSKH